MSKQKIMLKSLDKEKIFELGEKRESNYLVRDLVVILAKLILQEKVRKNRLVPKKAFFFRPWMEKVHRKEFRGVQLKRDPLRVLCYFKLRQLPLQRHLDLAILPPQHPITFVTKWFFNDFRMKLLRTPRNQEQLISLGRGLPLLLDYLLERLVDHDVVVHLVSVVGALHSNSQKSKFRPKKRKILPKKKSHPRLSSPPAPWSHSSSSL